MSRLRSPFPVATAVVAVAVLGGCGGGDETDEGAAELSPAPTAHACDLAPRAEIEEVMGEEATGEGIPNEGDGFTECVYDFGPEVTPILAITVRESDAELEFENYRALEGGGQVTVEWVEDLGDEAVYTEIADFPRLSARYGDVLLQTSVPDALGRDGATEVIELAAQNLGVLD